MTTLSYLEDSYKESATAQVMHSSYDSTLAMHCIKLDQTIFYPQGGGQPCDTGEIIGATGRLLVQKVRFAEDGTVMHYGICTGNFSEGETVTTTINLQKRLHHAQLHSAGHLIDIAVSLAGMPLESNKSYHFPEGAYVEYRGTLDNPSSYIAPLQQNLNQLIAENHAIIPVILSDQEARKRNITSPSGKAVRFVYVDGYQELGCGCGGTHLRTTAEITECTIRGISSKKGIVRISYK